MHLIRKEWQKFLLMIFAFLLFYFLPLEIFSFKGAIFEAFSLIKLYAREHVVLCLIPAFFIAGAISIFVRKASVLKYFGRKANKLLAYGVASISGSILAVCSCTVLPIFSSIYKRGAGLGPATAFLYSGPAINILAIILTARVLGWEIGLGRAVGAVIFSIIIGLFMHFIFLKEERIKKEKSKILIIGKEEPLLNPFRISIYFISMIGIIVFANWTKVEDGSLLWNLIFQHKWRITVLFLVILIYIVFQWLEREELKEWIDSTWSFVKQIFPLLFAGVFIAGLLLGRPDGEGIIPSHLITELVGSNSFLSNLFASIIGAFMYFATLTEIPIVQGLISSGMGKGPALALLLAGPALSLPNMLVIRSVLGNRKTMVYIIIVVVMATFSGMIFGTIV